jgi:hypothetical protein
MNIFIPLIIGKKKARMKKTLWLLALQGQIADLLLTFYASDETEAEKMASGLEHDKGAKRPDLWNTISPHCGITQEHETGVAVGVLEAGKR